MQKMIQKGRISILLFIILILIADWFQYFLYMLINYFNYRSAIPTVDLLLISSIFISPLIYSISLRLKPNPKILNIVVYLIVFILAVLIYIFYLSYNQIGIILDQNLGLDTVSPITGFATGDGNTTKRLMFIVNAIAFIVIIPTLGNKIAIETEESYQNNKHSIGIETIIAFILCSLYMGFRSGSMLSTPFRISIILIIALGILLILEIIEGTLRNEENHAQGASVNNSEQRIRFAIPVMILISFIFGVLSLGDFGVLYKSNLWFVGVIASAILLRAVMAKVEINKKWITLIKILWISLLALYCFSGMIGSLLNYLSIIKIGLVLSAALILSIKAMKRSDNFNQMNSNNSKMIYIIVRTYLGLIFFLFGLLLYFSQPFTNIAIFIIMILPSSFLFKSKSTK